MKAPKQAFKLLGTLWLMAGLLFIAWNYWSFRAQGFHKAVLESNTAIEVSVNNNYIAFNPQAGYASTLFFYPGALVDPFAYAPLCRKLSEAGYQVVIVRMPWRLASKGYKQIKELGLLSGNNNYTLIGHSQGGKMAAQFVYENPGLIKNLILLGTSHPRDIDLSAAPVNVLKILGENDGLASPDEVEINKKKLPATSTYIELKGANHSQFGYYGHQLGDHAATISHEQQLDALVSNMLAFLKLHREP